MELPQTRQMMPQIQKLTIFVSIVGLGTKPHHILLLIPKELTLLITPTVSPYKTEKIISKKKI
jgi:hypothetical protein